MMNKLTSKNFAIVGVAGYVAPSHLKAIKETNNNIIAALDLNDSVGVLDSYSFDIDFFTSPERFERHIEKLNGTKKQIDYISICAPNYVHDFYIRQALELGITPICEKPLVINPSNLNHLSALEKRTGKKIYNILQLRLHPTVKNLKNTIRKDPKLLWTKPVIKLKYLTPRGNWYFYSWKGDETKSGGLISNIGIHFFDILIWIFGKPLGFDIKQNSIDQKTIKGYIELENAHVHWELSIDPKHPHLKDKKPFRQITMNNQPIDFSIGFNNLHTQSYINILNNNGFGIEDARPSIDLVYKMRKACRGE